MGKLKRISMICMAACMIIGSAFTSFADVQTDSNAIMTLDLDDEDYSISTYSSLGTVTNTIDPSSKVRLNVYYYDSDEVLRNALIYATYRNGRWYYSHSVDGIITQVNVILYRSYGSLPAPGTYSTSFDLASDFSYDYSRIDIAGERSADNVASTAYRNTLSDSSWDQFSGDLLISPFVVDVGSVATLYFRLFIPASQSVSEIGGSFSWRFVQSTDPSAYPSIGSDTSSSDYQSSVSDSLGSISSSLDSAAENLQYISTSQNLIIQGIDNVIMHISDQLYAFWDQLFNLIHLPEMAKMDEIIDAIENIDLEVNINLDKLKSSIDDMNSDIQNKLQSTTDKITSGYDSSGLEVENSELSGAVTEYDQAEQEVMDSVTGNIESFEYPDVETMPGGILAALSFFGGFMQSCFAYMGDFNIVITLSLTMIFVLILVGYHRIRT